MPPREGIYGMLAEFNTPSELVYATEQAQGRRWRGCRMLRDPALQAAVLEQLEWGWSPE